MGVRDPAIEACPASFRRTRSQQTTVIIGASSILDFLSDLNFEKLFMSLMISFL